jgi:hypothetical protein
VVQRRPGGIRRGATIAVTGSNSLVMSLLAEAVGGGGWAAIVGARDFSPLPALEYGIDVARLALVPDPGIEWVAAVAALIDGFDVVVVSPPTQVSPAAARSVMARARQKETVLIASGRSWPGCEVTLEVTSRRWLGVRDGVGRLRQQQVTVSAAGRGRAAQQRSINTTLPPPSVVERVGPLPGEIPGLPVDFCYRPIRRLVPTPPRRAVEGKPDNWRRLFDGDSTADFGGPGEQYGRAG